MASNHYSNSKDAAKVNNLIELIEDVVKSLETRIRERRITESRYCLKKLDTIIETRNIVEKHIPEIQQSLKKRLLAKLDEMKIDYNEERFEQELALLLQNRTLLKKQIV